MAIHSPTLFPKRPRSTHNGFVHLGLIHAGDSAKTLMLTSLHSHIWIIGKIIAESTL
jgi:hypothetical protein